MRLRFEGVGFRWRGADRPALAEVGFDLPSGSFAAVLGPNGSGKSTLARLAAGLLLPDRGRVVVDDAEPARMAPLSRAARIALLPQGPEVPFPVTAGDLVLTGRYPHVGPWRREGARDHEIAREALARVGAQELAPREIHSLSGGERQRVFLARTLAQQPRLLVADEPTTHLDLARTAELVETLAHLRRDDGVTVVVVTHDLDLASSAAERILLLDAGRLVADGPPCEVLTPERIAAVFGVRAEWVTDASGRPRLLTGGRAGSGQGR